MAETSLPHRRGFGAGLVAGAIGMLVVLAIGAAIVVLGGLYNVSADTPHTALGKAVFGGAMEAGVKRGAGGLKAPAMDAAAILEGGAEYKEMCTACHGGPGVEPRAMTRGMQPRPPALTQAANEWSTEELFWIVKHGIKMSAMPAFGGTHDDATNWKIAAFVKQLPRMSAADFAAVPADEEAHDAMHEHGAAAAADGDADTHHDGHAHQH